MSFGKEQLSLSTGKEFIKLEDVISLAAGPTSAPAREKSYEAEQK